MRAAFFYTFFIDRRKKHYYNKCTKINNTLKTHNTKREQNKPEMEKKGAKI